MGAIDRETLERKLGFLNDVIDLDRVIAAVEPAIALCGSFSAWAIAHLGASPAPSGGGADPGRG